MAKALAVSASEGGEFEGFQGSGDGYPGIPSPFLVEHENEHEAQNRSQVQGPRAPSPTSLLPHLAMTQEDDDEGADLDGVVYTRRRVPPSLPGRSSNGGSDSRSRTSTSFSDRPAFRYPYQESTPIMPPSSSSSKSRPKSKSTSSSSSSTKKKKSKSKSTTRSSTTADSTSLASPTSQSFFPPDTGIDTTIATVLSPRTIEQGQGFFDIDDEEPHVYTKSRISDAGGKDNSARGEFPSAGLGMSRSGFGKVRGGAFLANTERERHVEGEDGEDYFDGTF